ncbi:MAG: cbb3-type cytochrome c oxidase subunit I, partial [Brevundimonas aurantiaca]|uniref:cbb3-type cytochrome c oxidase subunit I n=1 Tax=Brevundimonas aurantiaca TaxID=74316 RepID=UPI0040341273
MKSETGFDTALYERFPTKGERPEGELKQLEEIWCGPKGWQWITAINNNFVGVYYIGAAMLFFVLAGIQVFAWIATMAAGKMRFSTPGLFVTGALITFVMGGLTGVMVAMVPFDWQA